MRCSYCFEGEYLSNNPKDDMTLKEVKKFIDFAFEKDPHGGLTFFGGEPFSNPELLYKSLDYGFSKGFRMSVFSNGLYLTKTEHILEFLKHSGNVYLAISYDARFNYRRCNSSTTRKIESLLLKLKGLKERNLINFGISYTVRSDNYQEFTSDIVLLEETFNPTKIDVAFDAKDLGFKTYHEVCQEVRKRDLPFKGKVCALSCSSCEQVCAGEEVTWHCYKDKIIQGSGISNEEIFK